MRQRNPYDERKRHLEMVEQGLLCRFCFGSLDSDQAPSVRDRMCSKCEAEIRAGLMRVTLRGGRLMIGEQELANLVLENNFRWAHFDPRTGNAPRQDDIFDPASYERYLLSRHEASHSGEPGSESSGQSQRDRDTDQAQEASCADDRAGNNKPQVKPEIFSENQMAQMLEIVKKEFGR